MIMMSSELVFNALTIVLEHQLVPDLGLPPVDVFTAMLVDLKKEIVEARLAEATVAFQSQEACHQLQASLENLFTPETSQNTFDRNYIDQKVNELSELSRSSFNCVHLLPPRKVRHSFCTTMDFFDS
jgi:hypothetical protein